MFVSRHCTQLLLVLKALSISCRDLGPGRFSATGSARETRLSSVSWNKSFLVMYLDWLALCRRSILSTCRKNRESQMNSTTEVGFANTWLRTCDYRCKVQLVNITKPCRPHGHSSPNYGAVCIDLRSVFVPVPDGPRANSDFNPIYHSFYF